MLLPRVLLLLSAFTLVIGLTAYLALDLTTALATLTDVSQAMTQDWLHQGTQLALSL